MSVVQKFWIQGRAWQSDELGLQAVLGSLSEAQERPMCLCVPKGVPMYVARHGQWLVKRMPSTGHLHHPNCPSYDPDPSASGLGVHWGRAIRESELGFDLRLNFGLKARAAARRGTSTVHEVVNPTQPQRGLSLHGLMHWLFERARFNRWDPTEAGKRDQAALHKHLMAAAQDGWVRGAPLAQRLLVPEPFARDAVEQIRERRSAKLRALGTERVLVLGEFKATELMDGRSRIWIRHWPDWPLWVNTDLWRRLERSQAQLIEARATSQTLRMLMLAVLQPLREMTYQIHAASLMLTTAQWIPLHSAFEEQLIQRLMEERRRFIKPLWYDSPCEDFANVLLTDAGLDVVPLHLLSAFMVERTRMRKQEDAQKRDDWVWDTRQPWPGLPPRC